MARIKIEGLKEVTNELNRIRNQMTPNINKAIEDTVKFGKKLAADEIFNKYGYIRKSDVEKVFNHRINSNTLTGVVSAHWIPTAITEFEHSKRNKGFTVNVLRKNKIWYKGAFAFIAKNGKKAMINRQAGDKSWRYIDQIRADEAKTKIPNALWGPAVANIFRDMRKDLDPPIIRHLRERYRHHASR